MARIATMKARRAQLAWFCRDASSTSAESACSANGIASALVHSRIVCNSSKNRRSMAELPQYDSPGGPDVEAYPIVVILLLSWAVIKVERAYLTWGEGKANTRSIVGTLKNEQDINEDDEMRDGLHECAGRRHLIPFPPLLTLLGRHTDKSIVSATGKQM